MRNGKGKGNGNGFGVALCIALGQRILVPVNVFLRAMPRRAARKGSRHRARVARRTSCGRWARI